MTGKSLVQDKIFYLGIDNNKRTKKGTVKKNTCLVGKREKLNILWDALRAIPFNRSVSWSIPHFYQCT